MASVTIIFGGQEQRTVEITKPRMVVGRDPGCEIHIDNLGISRQHCAFNQKGDAFSVQDMGSSNGTYVNGRKVTELYLNNDDEVVIGKYTLKFRNEAQAAAAPAAVENPNTGVPDSLNTYVMDGAKIQEQLAKMRASGQGAASSSGEMPRGGTAADYANAMGGGTPEPAPQSNTLLIVLVVGLVAALGIILYLILSPGK